jgi:hypothetical protein
MMIVKRIASWATPGRANPARVVTGISTIHVKLEDARAENSFAHLIGACPTRRRAISGIVDANRCIGRGFVGFGIRFRF